MSKPNHLNSQFSPLLLVLLVRQSRRSLGQPREQGAEQGLTLIEGLLAIVIITITIIGITPPIFWATATRVQNQRAEQALSLAQGEIDRVRSLMERRSIGDTDLNNLPPVAPVSEAEIRDRTRVPAPNAAKSARIQSNRDCGTGVNDDGTAPTSINQYTQVDVNGDCEADFLVQTFRSPGLNERGLPFLPGNTEGRSLSAFVMGVRVYSSLAKPALDEGRGEVEPAQLKGTTGAGFQLKRPLAVVYSTVVRSADSDNLNVYRALCQGSSAC